MQGRMDLSFETEEYCKISVVMSSFARLFADSAGDVHVEDEGSGDADHDRDDMR